MQSVWHWWLQAICSFQARQLQVAGRCPTVLFFHGLSGLENACDSGLIKKGTCVLFNGASFLEDLSPEVRLAQAAAQTCVGTYVTLYDACNNTPLHPHVVCGMMCRVSRRWEPSPSAPS